MPESRSVGPEVSFEVERVCHAGEMKSAANFAKGYRFAIRQWQVKGESPCLNFINGMPEKIRG